MPIDKTTASISFTNFKPRQQFSAYLFGMHFFNLEPCPRVADQTCPSNCILPFHVKDIVSGIELNEGTAEVCINR
jgi:hypothetical protein